MFKTAPDPWARLTVSATPATVTLKLGRVSEFVFVASPSRVKVRAAPIVVMLPAPKARLRVAPKVRLPLSTTALFPNVTPPALVLSMAPPVTVKVPVPIAEALLMFKTPPERVVPPA